MIEKNLHGMYEHCRVSPSNTGIQRVSRVWTGVILLTIRLGCLAKRNSLSTGSWDGSLNAWTPGNCTYPSSMSCCRLTCCSDCEAQLPSGLMVHEPLAHAPTEATKPGSFDLRLAGRRRSAAPADRYKGRLAQFAVTYGTPGFATMLGVGRPISASSAALDRSVQFSKLLGLPRVPVSGVKNNRRLRVGKRVVFVKDPSSSCSS